MTQVPNVEGWAKAPRIAAALLVMAAVGLYLAGYFFLWSVKIDPLSATPMTTVLYWQHYGERKEVRQVLVRSLAAGLVLSFGSGLLFLLPRRRPLHGDARFATAREIREAKLLGHDGIILGRYGLHYLTLPGQQGVELEAPPRSGKGVGVVIPNLLNWPGSVIVNDIKGENFKITAGFRLEHGQEVHLFDPLSETGCSACWNPLAYVSTTVHYETIDELQRIGLMLYPDPQGADPFWSTSARSLFLGIALYLFQTPNMPRTIGEILRQGMASSAEGFQKHWKRLLEDCSRAKYPLSQETVQIILEVIDLAPVTASSIRKSFTSRLDLWLNPLIDAVTARNDFDFRELRKRPISIYCRVNPDNLSRLQPLLNLFFQQAIGLQTKELPEDNKALKYQLMLMLDEFAALGRIPVIADSTAFLPGYNVRTVIIVQSHAQLVQIYGPQGAHALRKMLAARIVFAPKEYEDAEAISKELGTYTVRQRSRTHRPFDNSGTSINTSDQPRRLLLPQEVKELGAQRMILFYEGLRPVLAGRIYHFRDRLLKRRLKTPPAVPKLEIPERPRVAVPPAGAAPSAAPEPPAGRPLKPDEVGTLEAHPLEDFSPNFDDIVIPKGRAMSVEEMNVAVAGVMAKMVC
jgi:type IV secretion system protein VirD4